MLRIQIEPSQRIIEATGKPLSPVKELTMYPAQFPILLREKMRGRTVAQVADHLGVKALDVIRLLEGSWRPSKEICRRMGIKAVYAITEPPSTTGEPNFAHASRV